MIQTYEEFYNYRSSMESVEGGEWVKYEDHLAIVQKLEERVRELEQSLESADGEVSDLMQQVAELSSDVSYYESQPYI